MPWLAPTLDGSPLWAPPGGALEQMLRAQDWVEVSGPQGPGTPNPTPIPSALVRTINGKTANSSGALALTAGDVGALDQTAGDTRYPRKGDLVFNALDGPQAVDRTGATATDVALQAAMNAAAAMVRTHVTDAYNAGNSLPVTEPLYIPAGEYKLNAPLVWPKGMNIEVSPAARFVAGASMSSMLTTSLADYHQGETVRGGIWDCNGLATAGLDIKYFSDMQIDDVLVLNAGLYGLVLGDSGAPTVPYEARVHNFRTKRIRGSAIPAGSYGVWLRNCTDAKLHSGVINGFETGTRVDTGGNLIFDYHCWNYGSSAQMTTCFDDNSVGNIYQLCYADTPSLFGWRFRTGSGSIIAGRGYMSSGGADNVATVVGSDNLAAGYSVVGLRVDSANASHRWKVDFGGTDLDYCDIVGVMQGSTACVTYALGSSGVRSRLRALRLGNAVNTSWLNGTRRDGTAVQDFLQFNDTQSGQVKGFRVGYTGSPTMPQYPTVSRPAASEVPYGQIVDTTLNKPIWSDGTDWRDATGTVV